MSIKNHSELMKEKLTIEVTRKELSLAIQSMIRLEHYIEQAYRTELNPDVVKQMEIDMKDLQEVYVSLKSWYGKERHYAYKK